MWYLRELSHTQICFLMLSDASVASENIVAKGEIDLNSLHAKLFFVCQIVALILLKKKICFQMFVVIGSETD